MPNATITIRPDRPAHRLRQRRLRLGLSRARLAGLARCSVTSIDNLEAGYIPTRSRVLPRVLDVLDRLEALAAANLGRRA